jgi:MoxR-like ATPase
MSVKQRIQKLLEELNKGVYEKEEIMALSLLSALAGESIFLLGAPGVAKSLIARRLKYAFKDGKSFEYLMTRFSTPDEIFGPVSIKKLKDEDKYERVVEKYLPGADVVFLDEIWKAGSSIQNTLLTVINEKVYRNGEQEIKVPMKALISASNELPKPKSKEEENLEALWDRLLVRLPVEGIKKKENFDAMISEKLDSYTDTVSADVKIENKTFEEWSKTIDDVEIHENVFNVIDVIRKKIQLHNDKDDQNENQIYISDRRWRKIVRLLRTSAFLNDRQAVDLMDCFLIKDCLWNEDTQIETARQMVSSTIEQYGYKLQFDFNSLKEELNEFREEIKEETKVVKDERVEELDKDTEGYYELENPPDNYNKFIDQDSYEQLTTEKEDIYLYYEQYNSIRHDSTWEIKKGKDKFHISVNDVEYKLKTIVTGEKRQITKKPHEAVEKTWDEKIVQYLGVTTQQKDELEQYRKKDLEHLRTNIFVAPELANIVESHLTKTLREIQKYEVEIRDIRNGYKSLKEETVVE